MSKIKPEDHPDFIGGWKWTKLELDWINERIGTLEAALFQAQEAAKDLEARLTKTEGWLNEAMWNYGELKREQLANSEETSSSPVQDWEAVAADQALTIALLKSETAAQPAPVQEPFGYVWFTKHMEHRFTRMKPHPDMGAMNIKPVYTSPPGQEPVAYTTGHCKEKAQPGGCQLHNLHCGYPACDRKAVTTPPAAQRQWVGLTFEDQTECLSAGVDNGWRGVMEATEAKLRAKNFA